MYKIQNFHHFSLIMFILFPTSIYPIVYNLYDLVDITKLKIAEGQLKFNEVSIDKVILKQLDSQVDKIFEKCTIAKYSDGYESDKVDEITKTQLEKCLLDTSDSDFQKLKTHDEPLFNKFISMIANIIIGPDKNTIKKESLSKAISKVSKIMSLVVLGENRDYIEKSEISNDIKKVLDIMDTNWFMNIFIKIAIRSHSNKIFSKFDKNDDGKMDLTEIFQSTLANVIDKAINK